MTTEDRVTEAMVLIRDMRRELRPAPHDGPGHRRSKRRVAELERRADALLGDALNLPARAGF